MEAGESNYNDNFSDYSEDFEEEEESEVRTPPAVPQLLIPQRLRAEPARNTKSHPTPTIKTGKATWRAQGKKKKELQPLENSYNCAVYLS